MLQRQLYKLGEIFPMRFCSKKCSLKEGVLLYKNEYFCCKDTPFLGFITLVALFACQAHETIHCRAEPVKSNEKFLSGPGFPMDPLGNAVNPFNYTDECPSLLVACVHLFL